MSGIPSRGMSGISRSAGFTRETHHRHSVGDKGAAVDDDVLAGYKLPSPGCEPDDGPGHLLRFTEAAERRLREAGEGGRP